MPNSSSPPIAWHRLLGEVLEKSLSPVGLLVYTELPVMNKPPKADILIIRREQAQWTEAQRERLPDGVRDSQARHLLLEFKYTESLSANASQQALSYDFFYKQTQELTESEVQTVLLCAKQPQANHLAQLGYVKTPLPGVYHSEWPPWLPPMVLLSLNELSDAPHNAFVKCFASKSKQKRKAFEVLWQLVSLGNFPKPLVLFLTTLWKHWFSSPPGGNMKDDMLTVEDFQNLGEHWKQLMLATLTVEDLLTRFRAEELLAQLKPADVLAQLKPADVLAHFKPEELLAHAKPEELENYENYLIQRKKPQRPPKAKAKNRG